MINGTSNHQCDSATFCNDINLFGHGKIMNNECECGKWLRDPFMDKIPCPVCDKNYQEAYGLGSRKWVNKEDLLDTLPDCDK